MARVLFVCLHNAGRSQMSEAFFEQMAQGQHQARSAGATPADRVHPEVLEALREVGLDLSAPQAPEAHSGAAWQGWDRWPARTRGRREYSRCWPSSTKSPSVSSWST